MKKLAVLACCLLVALVVYAAPDGYLDAPLPAGFDGAKFKEATGCAMDDFYAKGTRLFWRSSLGEIDLNTCVPTAEEVAERKLLSRYRAIDEAIMRKAMAEMYAYLCARDGKATVDAALPTMVAIVAEVGR